MLRKNETIVEIGKGLRRQDEDITHAPLPRRWVDLIRHLNEHERKAGRDTPAQKLSGVSPQQRFRLVRFRTTR